MTEDSKSCARCGAPRNPGARFCGGCGCSFSGAGEPRVDSPEPIEPAKLDDSKNRKSGSAGPRKAHSSPPRLPDPLLQASGAVRSGWQVVVGDQLPPVAAMIRSTVSSVVTDGGTDRASLRGQGVLLLLMTVFDAVSAHATKNPGALGGVSIRLGFSVVGFLSGMLSGRKRGILSKIAMVSSGGLALLEGGSLFGLVRSLANHSGPASSFLPNLVTQGLALLRAARMAWLSRK